MTRKTVLVTGANSGLGFEASKQLAERGWDVVLGVRTEAKADDARQRLASLTGRPTSDFGVALFDLTLPDTVVEAVRGLVSEGRVFDAVVLNGGGMPTPVDGKPTTVPTGLTTVFAMNVAGHALLVEGLYDGGLLEQGATVLFAGSEASRGIPSMGAAVPALADGFGDVDATLEAMVTGQHAADGYDPMVDYGFSKLVGTVWMANLAERTGLRALTVSPGFTGGTAAMDKLPTPMRVMFRYVALPIMKLFGNAHDVDYGAARYVQGLEDTSLHAGGFYASAGTSLSGDLAEQGSDRQPLLADAAFKAAVERLLASRVSGAFATHAEAARIGA
jgi:NAD(P)-dependent dehydrogenase (short-subunit alcohol dehydrogenase family)